MLCEVSFVSFVVELSMFFYRDVVHFSVACDMRVQWSLITGLMAEVRLGLC